MGYVSGICSYHGENAHCENIPDLKHVRGVLYFGQGKVHCFKANSQKRQDAPVVIKKKAVLLDPVPVPESETPKQAERLWNSALKKDPVPGLVEGRIFGTVKMWDGKNGFGFIRIEDDIEYYTCRFEVASDEYNRRFLLVGETVSFRTKSSRTKKGSQLSAVAVIPTPRVDPQLSAPADHREEMRVVEYDPVKGIGRLSQVSDPTAKFIFFSQNDVSTIGGIYPGARFWCGFHRSLNFTQGFYAFDIEIIKED
jgi:cold shock CspA family protein